MASIQTSASPPRNPAGAALRDIAVILLLCALAWSWPLLASPGFWADADAQRDILGADAQMYFGSVRDSVKLIAFERRPMFGAVLLPLRFFFKSVLGMSDANAAAAAFRVVAMSVPVLAYAFARLVLGWRASLVLALLAGSSMVVMFHALAFESYALTMAVGLLAGCVAAAMATVGFPLIAARPVAAGALAVVTVVIAGWTAITLTSILLPFVLLGLAVLGARRGIAWAAAVTVLSGVLLVLPSLLVDRSSQVQQEIIEIYFDVSNLFSTLAWTYVVVAHFIAAYLYPGSVLSGSRHPDAVGPEDWMGPIVADALANPASIAVGAVIFGIALLSLAWVGRRPQAAGMDGIGILVVGLWGCLLASLVFYVMWIPSEAALFTGCVWPFLMMLVILGRARIGERAGRAADLLILCLALAFFIGNLGTLNSTAAFYGRSG